MTLARRSLGRLLLPLLLVASGAAEATIPAAERQVLLDLYDDTNGAGWTTSTGWNGASGTECSWAGVACDGSELHVTAIELSYNNLQGTLPPLTGLPQLDTFDVAGNSLTGVIPSLTGLPLVTFNVANNAFNGPVPSLAGQTALRALIVLGNQLGGPFPSISALTSLETFSVSSNQFTGALPSPAGLTSLTIYSAYSNLFSGPIPSLAGLTALGDFSVSNNALTGNIPSLSGLGSLVTFEAGDNQLTGSIPSLAGLSSLFVFNASQNQLTGTIPSLSGLSQLYGLFLSNNELTGSIPSFSGLGALGYVVVSNNLLDGTIPNLADAPALEYFFAYDNQLTGSIPPIAGLGALTVFDVQNNQLGGSLPSFAGLPSLQTFIANDNALTGSVPSLSGAPALTAFLVRNNALDGTLPASLGALTELENFDVAANPLTGPIPVLTGLTKLETFAAYDTKLDGPIPSLAGLTSLQYFSIYYSNVEGPIPALTGLSNLLQITLDGNQLTGSLPSLEGLPLLQTFTASYNRLTGEIPPLAGQGLASLALYDVTHNQLTGPVPELAGVGDPAQFWFWASQNQLSGEIPSLAGANNLQLLELGQNLLTGEPPEPPTNGILLYATLCSNPLEPTASAYWDAKTQIEPWYEACTRLTAGPSLPIGDDAAGVGTAVAAAEGLIAVGAPQSLAEDQESGQVLVYSGDALQSGKAAAGKQGRFEAKALAEVTLATLELPFPLPGDKFGGGGVAASPDGNTIVAGAPGANANTGSVAIFIKPQNGWTAKVLPTEVLVPPEATPGTQVGTSVAVTNAGTIVVGGPGATVAGQAGAGSVWIIRKGNNTYSISVPIRSATPQPGAGFGTAVSGEGSELAIGAPGQNASQGQVETFREAAGNYAPLDVVTDLGGSAGDRFGTSVSITDGQMIVGAPGRDAPQAPNAGAAMVYAETDTGVSEPTAMLLDDEPQAGAELGTSVQMSGDVAIVGAPLTDVSDNPNQGEAEVYVQPDYGTFTGAIIPTGVLFNASGDANFGFGTSVAIYSGLVAVGEPFFGGITIAAKRGNRAKALAGTLTPGQAVAYTDDVLFKEGYESPRGAVGNCTFPNTTIPDATVAGIDSDFPIAATGNVKDLNVSVFITHTFVSDLRITLEHIPSGKTVPLYIPTINCPSDNLDVDFDDQALSGFAREQCSGGTPAVEGRLLPNDWFTRVQGVTRAGPWRLKVSDAAAGNTGTLKSWCIEAR